MYALDYPGQVGEPPVRNAAGCVTGRAGSHSRIRTCVLAVAEVLGKSPNAPITVEEMKGLRETRRAENRGIHDWTGHPICNQPEPI